MANSGQCKSGLILIAVILAATAFAADIYWPELKMENYPNIFISNSRLDVNFVVGEFADPQDVIALVEIAGSLQDALIRQLNDRNLSVSTAFEIDASGNSVDALKDIYMDVLNKKRAAAAKTTLDTYYKNISDFKDKNLILIGGPCVNWLSAYFAGYPADCTEGFQHGKGYMQMFRNGKGIALMVAGYSKDDTRMAAGILANYRDFSSNFVGDRVKISSAWIDQVQIR